MYRSVRDTARRWGISERRVRVLCSSGRIAGAYQVGRGWNIPEDASKPADGRFRAETIEEQSLEEKLSVLSRERRLTAGEERMMLDELSTDYIYNSEALSGSPFSIRETELALRNLSVYDQPAVFWRAAVAHKKAFDFILESAKVKRELTPELIQKVHALLLQDSKEDAGRFRCLPVRQYSSSFSPVAPQMIEPELSRLLYDLSRSRESLPVRLARFHIGFESIRPFLDGNGRVGRLLLVFELLKAGYPPAVFRFTDRRRYYDAFEHYHSTGDPSEMRNLITEYISDQLDFRISTVRSRYSMSGTLAAQMEPILRQFDFEGTPVSCEVLGEGHVNRSYLVTVDSGKRYVLQCMSSVAFHDVPGLMNNVISVSRHIASKGGRTLRFIPARSGEYYYQDAGGDYWRCYEMIDALCLQSAEQPEDFLESAVAFGSFQNMLSDFPAETLVETIPQFHDTPDRYAKLHRAIDADPLRRVRQVLPELEFALSREHEAGQLIDMLSAGELPLRVTHNDTKLNNVLLDKETRKALCVIDLDTVMPGLSAFDFGDAIRFGASTAAEDEQDLSRVKLNLYLYRLFARGFLKACPKLTENEKEVLALGAKLITLECGVRFLTDYLEGDHYFQTSYPEQNLDRARTQFKLVQDMEDHWNELNSIVKEESYRFV